MEILDTINYTSFIKIFIISSIGGMIVYFIGQGYDAIDRATKEKE